MTWYKTGTVSVTNGSPNVTLAGGDALQNIFPDDGFFGPDGNLYPVLTIGGSDVIILGTPYAGATAAGAAYLTVPIADYTQLRDLLAQVNALVTGYQDIAVNAGIGLFEPGSAAAPGVRGVGHEGTGLVWNGDDSLSVSVAGTIVATYKAGDGGTVISPKLEVKSATSATTITVISALTASLYRSGITFIWAGAAGGARIEAVRDPILGGAGLKFQTTVNVAAEATGTYRDSLVVTNKGNVGIGTSAPTGKLEIFGGASGTQTDFIFGNNATALVTRVNTSNGIEFRTAQSVPMIWYTSGLQRAVLGANGDFGIGTTSPVSKLEVAGTGTNRLTVTSDLAGSFYTSSVDLRRSGTLGGARIESLRNAAGGVGFSFQVTADNAAEVAGTYSVAMNILGNRSVVPGADNTQSFGAASFRWSVVYAGTGTINTSDAREKTWRGGLTEAEERAALRISDEIGLYQWNDAISEKGADDARLHCGVRAQAVWSIMIDEGLVDTETYSRYAFLCYDEWEEQTEAVTQDITIPAVIDEDGNEVDPERIDKVDTGETRVTLAAGDRYGVRVDQLNSFILAAMNARQKRQDERLEAIEHALESAG